MFDIVVRKAAPSSRYAERLLEALKPLYVGPPMRFTQRFGALFGKLVSELKRFSVEHIRKWAGWWIEAVSRFATCREKKSVVPDSPISETETGRYYL